MAGLSAISAIPVAGYAAAPAKAANWMMRFKKLVGTPLAKFGKKYVAPPIAKYVAPPLAKLGAKGTEVASKAGVESGEAALGYGRLGYELSKSKLFGGAAKELKAAEEALAASNETVRTALAARRALEAGAGPLNTKTWKKLDNAFMAAKKQAADAGMTHRRLLDVPATTRAAEKAAKIHKASRGQRDLARVAKGVEKGTAKAAKTAKKLASAEEKAYLRTPEGFLKQLADRQAADVAGATTSGAKSIINKKYAMTRLFVDLKGILKVDTLKGRMISRTFVKWLDDADEDQQASLLRLIDVANGDPGSQDTQEALIRLAQFKSAPPTEAPYSDEGINSASTQVLKNLYYDGPGGPAGFLDRYKDHKDVMRDISRIVTGEDGAPSGYQGLFNLLNTAGITDSKKDGIKKEVMKLIIASATKS